MLVLRMGETVISFIKVTGVGVGELISRSVV